MITINRPSKDAVLVQGNNTLQGRAYLGYNTRRLFVCGASALVALPSGETRPRLPGDNYIEVALEITVKEKN